MKRIMLAAVLYLAVVHLADPQAHPDPPKGQITVTVHLCNPPATETEECRYKLQKWMYEKDTKDLIDLLIEEFKETGMDHVDQRRRDRIKSIESRLKKEQP